MLAHCRNVIGRKTLDIWSHEVEVEVQANKESSDVHSSSLILDLGIQ